MSNRKIDFSVIVEDVIETLRSRVKYEGDISDLGNEIGYAIGKSLPNMNGDEIHILISGLQHGISLTNGTH